MNPIYFCNEGCSSVAFCVSPKGEKELAVYLNSTHVNNFSELRQCLYGPFSDDDTEMYEKAGSILRIWSRCKWTEQHDVARFIHFIAKILSPDDYLLIRIGSENLEDTVQDGNFFNNPFRLWAQRRLIFIDDADQLRTTVTEQKERESQALRAYGNRHYFCTADRFLTIMTNPDGERAPFGARSS